MVTRFQAHLVTLTIKLRQMLLDQRLEVAARRHVLRFPLEDLKRLNQIVERRRSRLSRLGHGRDLQERGCGTRRLSSPHYPSMADASHLFFP
jgi:hypothetical protein